jgi:alpha-1,2-mannosyltransferase
MGKKAAVFLVDMIVLLFMVIIIAILITGGFSFSLGPVNLKAHSLKNPLIIMGAALILRRWIAGSFLQGFSAQSFRTYPDHLGRRWRESSLFRTGMILALISVLLLTAYLIRTKPLQPGLLFTGYRNSEWAGDPVITTPDTALDLTTRKRVLPGIIDNYSLEWRGMIFIPKSGDYQFITISDDGSEVYLDERLVVNNGGFHGLQEQIGTASLEKGFHPIRIRYMQGLGDADFRIYWKQPGQKRAALTHAPLFLEKKATTIPDFRLYQIRQGLLPLLIVFWGLVIIMAAFAISPSIPPKWRFWQDLSPLTVKLLLFVLLNSVVLNLCLLRSGYLTTLEYTWFFVSSPAHDRSDSWQSMHRALEYLRNPHNDLLYTQVFFQERMKLQYPPTSLLAFKPFTGASLSALASGANFAAWLGIIATIGILVRIFALSLQKYMPSPPGGEGRIRSSPFVEKIARLVLSACFTLTFYPLVKSFQLGQIQSWIYVLFILAMWTWMSDYKAVSGVLIGLICVLKPQLGLLAFWGLLRKQWRFASSILITAGVLLLISLWVFGLANHLDYLPVLSFMSQHGESYHPNQSFNGLLHRLFLIGSKTPENPFVFPPYNPWVYAGTLVSSALLILTALFWKCRQYQHANVTDFCIAALSFTMASPIAWQHHYGILLPLFTVILPITLASRLKLWGGIVLIISFVLSSNYYQMTDRLTNTPLNFLQSYLFFGALGFLGFLYGLRATQQHAEE